MPTRVKTAQIYTLITLPGATVKYYCKDGLSSLTVMHVGQILQYGGKLVPVNCGAGNEWAALNKAQNDMFELWNHEHMSEAP